MALTETEKRLREELESSLDGKVGEKVLFYYSSEDGGDPPGGLGNRMASYERQFLLGILSGTTLGASGNGRKILLPVDRYVKSLTSSSRPNVLTKRNGGIIVDPFLLLFLDEPLVEGVSAIQETTWRPVSAAGHICARIIVGNEDVERFYGERRADQIYSDSLAKLMA